MRLKRHVPLLESSMKRAILPSVTKSLCIRCRRHASTAYPENIAVLGGGISGLSSAYFASKEFPKSKITLYEAGKEPGGWIQSRRVQVPGGSVLFEHGPRTLRPGPDSMVTVKLIQDLGLVDDVITTSKEAVGAKNRFIYYPDRLNLMPGYNVSANYFGLLASGVFAGMHKLLIEMYRDVRDPSIRDESIGSFITRRLDKRPVQRLISAVFHGIYAGDVWKLSARTLLAMAWQLEKKGDGVWHGWRNIQSGSLPGTYNFLWAPYYYETRRALNEEVILQVDEAFRNSLNKSSVFAFKNGLQQLVDALHKDLIKNPQVNLALDTPVCSYNMASNGEQQVEIVAKGKKPRNYDLVISTLREPSLTPYVTVMTVNLYYSKPDLLPVKGFGYLIPQGVPFEQNPERALGVTFDSDAVQGQDTVEGTKITVMIGGHWWDGWKVYPDSAEGLELAKAVVRRHLRITEEPTASDVGLWKDCIPQYTVGYEDRLRDHVDQTRNRFKGRLRLAGAQYNGVSVNNCIEQAWMLARGLRGNGWKEMATGLDKRTSELPWKVVNPVHLL